MPVWGKVFSSKGDSGKGGGAYWRRAAIELKRYLESIQKHVTGRRGRGPHCG